MAGTRKFDANRVLDAAMDVFWREGYQGASIDVLVKATGIGRGSMYNSYGDKHGLFMSALDRYDDTVASQRLALLEREGSPRAALRGFFEAIAQPLHREADDQPLYGCLINRAAVELCPGDPYVTARVEWSLQKQEKAFQSLLDRAHAAGELADGKDRPALARYLTMALQGLLVASRGFSDNALARDGIDAIMASLD